MRQVIGAMVLVVVTWSAASSLTGAAQTSAVQTPATQTTVGPAPPGQNRPGYPTLAQTLVLNKTPADAVAVKVFNPEPLQTSIVGVPTVALTSGTVVEVRAARQRWEYRRIVTVNAGDPIDLLNAAGADGWEAVGTSPVDATHTALLLKRAQ